MRLFTYKNPHMPAAVVLHYFLKCFGLAACLWAGIAQGASVLTGFAPNGFLLDGSATAGFMGATMTDSTSASDFLGGTVTDYPPVGVANLVVSSPAPSTPTSGTGLATGTIDLTFDFGDAVTSDQLAIALDGTASALTAKNSIGEDSAAFINLTGSFGFFLDAGFGGVAADDLVGYFDFTMPTLLGVEGSESLSALWKKDDITVDTLGPGDVLTGTSLQAAHFYELSLSYELTVPFGIDPTIEYDFTGTLTAIPLPPAVWLLGSGLIGLIGIARRKAA